MEPAESVAISTMSAPTGSTPSPRYRIRHDGSYQFTPFRIEKRRWFFFWVEIGSESTLAKAEKHLRDRIEGERLMLQVMRADSVHYDENGDRI